MFANATRFYVTIRQTLQSFDKLIPVVEVEKNAGDIFLKYLDSFEETAIWIVPKVKQGCPMKEQRDQEFGINFSQNAPGVLAVPFINREVFFPEFEEHLDLPANF